MKKVLSCLLALILAAAVPACSSGAAAPTPDPDAQPSQTSSAQPSEAPGQEEVEIIVFAAASMTETLNEIAQDYKTVAPHVTLVFNFDSSGTLKTQIQEGAECDLFISAAQKQMNQLDAAKDAEGGNTEGLDYIRSDSRVNLLENKVVLVAPQGNPAGVTSFEDAATGKVQLMALGNSDVPVGQYSEEIFTYLGLWEQLNEGQKITFGTNVKEVTSQVAAGSVDCGVIYATDAASAIAAGDAIEVVAQAPEGSHAPVIYPAAVLKDAKYPDEAQAFLDYLRSSACTPVFESVGFSIPQ
ncbi:molybdate ABC transporter substrate-binding protein [Pseudoflavonifractor sp. 524-17]|uniref:molybdate ABC transporter substrate-binding protein n=1 Tax=Pseudoflavonifractor sp. 524-17 TaxID=2304577 RepID=UPI001379C275|nr:molybdate ABC transporter substrate-binding protein [Pseudoflavonifractor sp. 524-17]NCE64825.1 molybdate ABC transporter substrate-binding protein [Pseudoflavonifractor sp. 524-17]